MTTIITPPPAQAPAPVAPPVAPVVTDGPNPIGLAALALAVVGFVLAIFIVTAGLAWLLLLPAIILAVIGLTRPRQRKGTSLAALIVAVVGLILSFVGFHFPTGVADSVGALNNSGVSPGTILIGGASGTLGNTGGTGPAGGTGGDGTTVTVDPGVAGTGVSVAVDSVDCGQPLVDLSGVAIVGTLCAVNLTVTNGSGQPIDIDSSSLTAYAGGTGYVANATLGDSLTAHVAAGDSATGKLFVNLPTGSPAIDTIRVSTTGDPVGDVTVKVN